MEEPKSQVEDTATFKKTNNEQFSNVDSFSFAEHNPNKGVPSVRRVFQSEPFDNDVHPAKRRPSGHEQSASRGSSRKCSDAKMTPMEPGSPRTPVKEDDVELAIKSRHEMTSSPI